MSGVNKVILLGRLVRDPETKDAGGLQICNFSVATSEEWKDESGEKKEKAEFHNVVCFKKLAEISGKYLQKGRQVYVEGKLTTRSWDDKETGQKKYKTEIVASTIQFVGDNKKTTIAEDTNASGSAQGFETTSSDNDEIPF
jgi:single-strand DNA-binding protein